MIYPIRICRNVRCLRGFRIISERSRRFYCTDGCMKSARQRLRRRARRGM